MKFERVSNTLAFFEDNIEYFVRYSLEFQRLVGQLETRDERQLFLHTVYTYYYPDVLLLLHKISKEKRIETEKLKNDLLSDNIVQREFVVPENQKVDPRKIALIFGFLL